MLALKNEMFTGNDDKNTSKSKTLLTFTLLFVLCSKMYNKIVRKIEEQWIWPQKGFTLNCMC